jgi:hypothetical protein
MEGIISRSDPQKRQQWQKKIADWKQSGLSGVQWCKENNETYGRWEYWKEQVLQKPKQTASIEFKEIKAESSNPIETGLELQVGKVTVKVEQDFDESTLSRLLPILGRMI